MSQSSPAVPGCFFMVKMRSVCYNIIAWGWIDLIENEMTQLAMVTELAEFLEKLKLQLGKGELGRFFKQNILILCCRAYSINVLDNGKERFYSVYHEDGQLKIVEGLNIECRVCFNIFQSKIQRVLSEKKRILNSPFLLVKYLPHYWNSAVMLDETYFRKEIIGDHILLRSFREDEAQQILLWYLDRDLNRLAGYAYTEPNLEKIKCNMLSSFGKDPMNLVIEYRETGEAIGTIQLYEMNRNDGNCMLGIRIGNRDYQGKGLGLEAVNLITEYALDELKMKRVSLTLYEYNENALKCYKKAGFEVEGRLRKSAKIEGEYYDEILMSRIHQ